MNSIRLFRLGWLVVLGFIVVADVAFAPIPSEATQAPRISLDMVISGNTYDETTNTMTIGAVDNCLVSDSPNNAQHNHTTHLIIQDVEDLVGWQARLNYDGGRMRPFTVNFTPFTDNATLQDLSFVNLPLEAGVHRSVVTAATIPPQAAGPQTALLGSVYNGSQSLSVSADTPAKSPPDDTSYSAPSGGVLAAVNLQVLAGQASTPGLYIDLDDADPNSPGSNIVFFTGTGSNTAGVPEGNLGDGFHGEGVPCLPVTPPAVALPPPPALSSAAEGSSALADSDNDGFSDTVEPPARTDPLRPCGIEAWPADINNDGTSDVTDIARLTGNFGAAVPPAPARYNIAPDPPDAYVDISDISIMLSLFGRTCIGSTARFLGPCGVPELSNHWYTQARSGSGDTNRGTKVWTYTPWNWSVDRTKNGSWNQAAWLWHTPEFGQPGANSIEVGFYSGWFPYDDSWTAGLVPYWTLDNGRDEPGYFYRGRFEEPNREFVSGGSWVPIEAVSNGPSRVWGYTFFPRDPETGLSYVVQTQSMNYVHGEITYEWPLKEPGKPYTPEFVGTTRTWMGGGAGEGFWGYWTDSNNPNASSPNKWYVWGFHNDCADDPYWINAVGNNDVERGFQWANGGYGE